MEKWNSLMLKFFLTTHLVCVCVFHIHDGNIWLLKKKSRITNSRNEMKWNEQQQQQKQHKPIWCVGSTAIIIWKRIFSKLFSFFFSFVSKTLHKEFGNFPPSHTHTERKNWIHWQKTIQWHWNYLCFENQSINDHQSS